MKQPAHCGMTAIEVLAATMLAALMFGAVAGIMGSLLRQERELRAGDNDSQWHAPLAAELSWDLANSRQIVMARDGAILIGFAARDFATGRPTGRRAVIKYYLVDAQGQRWLLRREDHPAEHTNDSARVELVCRGIDHMQWGELTIDKTAGAASGPVRPPENQFTTIPESLVIRLYAADSNAPAFEQAIHSRSAILESMLRRLSHRRGYVLILTLGLITLTAMSLTAMARYSLALASSAREAAEDLQIRWGVLSARHVLLARAGDILNSKVRPNEAVTPPWPKPANVSASFHLKDQKFTVLIGDEDAKLNLNTIYARKRDQVLPAVRRISHASGSFSIRLVPEKLARVAFGSWGQVFDLGKVSNTNDLAIRLRDLTRTTTLWGSGRLNLRRASDAAVYEVAQLELSTKDASELVSLRKNWSGQSTDDLLSQLALRRPELLAANRLFSAESRNYSVWIEINNGQRTRSYEYLDDGGGVGFVW